MIELIANCLDSNHELDFEIKSHRLNDDMLVLRQLVKWDEFLIGKQLEEKIYTILGN